VSMENIKQVSEICRRYGIRVFIDAARFAENAYFIKTREEGYQDKSIPEIVREMFSYADGFTFSAKKDALVNIGGMIGIKDDEELYMRLRELVIVYEGFPTYGGLAGRDLEAMSRGLREVLSFDYLQSRISQVQYLGQLLSEAGIPIQTPVGGHAVFVDAGKMLPHLPWDSFPSSICAQIVEMHSSIVPGRIKVILVGENLGL